MINGAPYRRVAEELRKDIENTLASVGLLCRVFGRGKTATSLERKIRQYPEKYAPGKKLIQDSIGIRVVVYFPEDVSIVEELLRANFTCDNGSCTIDLPNASEFSVTRHNLIFRIPNTWSRDVVPATAELPVDSTFEVQLRTILSEGWHEVEHDLRYKRKDDWYYSDSLSRNLNGVAATLETAEWSMRKIFDDLAYQHYKAKRWEAMLHSVLRMRVGANLSPELVEILDVEPIISKGLLRLNRASIFLNLAALAPQLPVTLDNIVFLWNFVNVKNKAIIVAMPTIVAETLEASLPVAPNI